jgi:hypothetical protein
MPDRSEAAAAADELSPDRVKARRRWRFVQRAPGPEEPSMRDRVGAQKGLIIILAGGGLFWLAVAGLVALLLR